MGRRILDKESLLYAFHFHFASPLPPKPSYLKVYRISRPSVCFGARTPHGEDHSVRHNGNLAPDREKQNNLNVTSCCSFACLVENRSVDVGRVVVVVVKPSILHLQLLRRRRPTRRVQHLRRPSGSKNWVGWIGSNQALFFRKKKSTL